jgi:hypothetical protein
VLAVPKQLNGCSLAPWGVELLHLPKYSGTVVAAACGAFAIAGERADRPMTADYPGDPPSSVQT